MFLDHMVFCLCILYVDIAAYVRPSSPSFVLINEGLQHVVQFRGWGLFVNPASEADGRWCYSMPTGWTHLPLALLCEDVRLSYVSSVPGYCQFQLPLPAVTSQRAAGLRGWVDVNELLEEWFNLPSSPFPIVCAEAKCGFLNNTHKILTWVEWECYRECIFWV